MIVKKIYRGTRPLDRIFRNGKLIFSQKEDVVFHRVEDGKLIILGAKNANSQPEGLYLDCAPDVAWIYPVLTGNVLTLEQVYSAVQNGNVLEVE